MTNFHGNNLCNSTWKTSQAVNTRKLIIIHVYKKKICDLFHFFESHITAAGCFGILGTVSGAEETVFVNVNDFVF